MSRAARAATVPAPGDRLDTTFPVPGAVAGGENAVPVFEGFHDGSLGMRSVELREGANPQ